MPEPKRLSGREVLKILERYGFQKIAQKGSHVKLKRIREAGSQSLTIPDHKELDSGTLRAIFYQASQFIDPDLLKRDFFSE